MTRRWLRRNQKACDEDEDEDLSEAVENVNG